MAGMYSHDYLVDEYSEPLHKFKRLKCTVILTTSLNLLFSIYVSEINGMYSHPTYDLDILQMARMHSHTYHINI